MGALRSMSPRHSVLVSGALPGVKLHKTVERAVVRLLYIVWEGAGRQLVHAEVKPQALATVALPGAGIV